jgi:pilus assembly protein FimV
VPESAPADSGPVDDSMSDDVLLSPRHMDSERRDESGAKLDLARAFVEMDDPAVARDLLEEVVQHGSDEQRADAAALLEKLG